MNEQDPEIRTLLGQVNKWWDDHPFHVTRIETKGRFLETSTLMHNYVEAGGRRAYIGETTSTLPFRSQYIFTVISGVGYYYFPESNSYVSDGAVVAYETFLESSVGPLSQVNMILVGAKLRGLRTVAGVKELFFKMDATRLGIGPANSDIDFVIEYDDIPRFNRMRQLRIGLEQMTTYTYLADSRDAVLAGLPTLPPLAQARRDISFDAALKKDILHFRTLQAQGV